VPPFRLPRAFGSLAQRFLDIIHNWEAMQHGCSILVRAAKCLELPVIVTEQYTKVFGKTVPELAEHLEGVERYEKTMFSMVTPAVEKEMARLNRRQVVLFGIEAHVCVLQTALDLIDRGYCVWVVVDGVSSSRPTERAVALMRLSKAGAMLTTYESLLFELMGNAKAPNFKAVSALIKEPRPEPELPFMHMAAL